MMPKDQGESIPSVEGTSNSQLRSLSAASLTSNVSLQEVQ